MIIYLIWDSVNIELIALYVDAREAAKRAELLNTTDNNRYRYIIEKRKTEDTTVTVVLISKE